MLFNYLKIISFEKTRIRLSFYINVIFDKLKVKKAAIMAYRDMIKGCCSLDAVERAICHMERKKYFNCAYGGSLDANGEVVMDAAIMMDNFRAGCVGAVRNIAHPITLGPLYLNALIYFYDNEIVIQ